MATKGVCSLVSGSTSQTVWTLPITTKLVLYLRLFVSATEGMKTVLSLTNDKVLELGLRCLSVYTSMRASYMKQMAEARKATERRRSIDHEMTLKWSEADHKRLRAAQESWYGVCW
ncbi:hypothetical protein SARC_10842 [Sphaeroforma arctica JP610]|uniref:Uncharacterized protein n=1 Tax=Sphaeroforma arctica JP610 TaxID=667725 RepID=A0A0L0FJN3_9EUKA|nr:hypothetical protein SARC_10842 [Sphaeroforma arctica JP610]KNC76671.1 hypothetical protein SARC_10842 [Sphaeroforma arctica JP610]|eukprot:XP_014150573.1 hypothetical protein SARC_10842 [Sphaeroforma arctica JP610]